MTRSTLVRLTKGVVLALVIGHAPSVSGDELTALLRASSSIRSDELQHHVDVLADDSFEGREAGKRGGYAAAGYLVDLLRKYGAEPAGDNDEFFQVFGKGYRNILGQIPGVGDALANEVVIIGAHYDHVGYGSSKNSFGPTGLIHNGADDNASGVAGLLEILQAIHESGLQPQRTLLFCFWDGEEKGLLGSKHWARRPTINFERVVFAFNLDMIGQLNGALEIHGVRTAAGLRRLVSQANKETKLKLDFQWKLKSNSDHHSFCTRGVPVLMFHTGLHDKYHRPTDDADTLNAAGMEYIGRLALAVVWRVAQASDLAGYRRESMTETHRDKKRLHSPHPPVPPRLGIGWPDELDTSNGVVVSRVRADSPAARAGIQVGDRLVRLNDNPIESLSRFQLELHAAKSPVLLDVFRSDADGPFKVSVTLNGSPSRIGFSWRPDRGDSQAMVITRVTPGSAAASAGVRVGDHAYQLNGQRILSSKWFLEQLIHDAGPFKIQLDRDGIWQELTIEPLPPVVRSDA